MARPGPVADPVVPPGVVPEGTTELGIDIIKVDRIAHTIERFGERFSRPRADRRASGATSATGPRTSPAAGPPRRPCPRCWGWACAASAGRRSRSSGCRPASRRSASTGGPPARAEQLGMGRIAVSISHEAEYAVAVAFGVRTAGGRYVFPLDIDDRLDDRERKLLARFERMREIHERDPGAGGRGRRRRRGHGAWLTSARSGSGGRVADDGAGAGDAAAPSDAPPELDDDVDGQARPRARQARPQGQLRPAARDRRVARLRGRGAARVPGRGSRRAPGSSRWPCPSRCSRCSRPRSSRRRRWRCPRTTSRRSTRSPRWPRCWTTSTTRSSSAPGCGRRWRSRSCCGCCSPRPRRRGPPAVLDAEALRTLAAVDEWWTRVTRPCVLTPHAGEFARLRAGQRPRRRRGRRPHRRRRRARARGRVRRRGSGARSSCSRAPRRSSRRPTASVAMAPFENPAMATGGTGDVLAGTIGALLAQGLAPFDAARLGVYLHGLAGEAVRDRIGDAGLLAGDLPDALPIGPQAARADRGAPADGTAARVRRAPEEPTRRPPTPGRRPRPDLRAGRRG